MGKTGTGEAADDGVAGLTAVVSTEVLARLRYQYPPPARTATTTTAVPKTICVFILDGGAFSAMPASVFLAINSGSGLGAGLKRSGGVDSGATNTAFSIGLGDTFVLLDSIAEEMTFAVVACCCSG